MRYDSKSEIKELVALNFQTINTDTTTNGNIIDTQGYLGLTFIMQAGTVTLGDVTMKIEHGDDSGLSDAAEVSDTFLIGTEALSILDAANEVSRIGYVGKKRYVRLSAVTANSANLQVGSIAVLNKAYNVPTA